ncbi:DUF1365 family protein [Mycobacterium asiaticum]|uniref:DUF1365 domain-containing protein n=1 Tax=Mycobacterium asiaticum TaxID=1790 RepID=A0A1A3NVF1_MYCAS|nr:DUF1365 family protein [Mycobacterium asiaticum]OBK25004.1 hypothetical protein A5635_16720 [Mycobacterium asiaticum]
MQQTAAPVVYRTTIRHARRVPVHGSFEYRSYSWYVDIDRLPRLPWWVRPFARLDGSLRQRLEGLFADRDIPLPGGPITALLQASGFGSAANPLSIFWCHDRDGQLRHVVADMHDGHGGHRTYLLPPADGPVLVREQSSDPPSSAVSHYLVSAPQPERQVDIRVSQHHGRRLTFTAALRGERLPASASRIAVLHLLSPLAPVIVTTRVRMQGFKAWLRRAPVVRQ